MTKGDNAHNLARCAFDDAVKISGIIGVNFSAMLALGQRPRSAQLLKEKRKIIKDQLFFLFLFVSMI